MVYMNYTELMFQDLLIYCPKNVRENHNNFFYFGHGCETNFLVLAQTLIYVNIAMNHYLRFYEKHVESNKKKGNSCDIGYLLI